MVGEDDDVVAAGLEAYGGVDDEPLGATDAQIWVEEDDGLGVIVVISASASRVCGGGVGSRGGWASRCHGGGLHRRKVKLFTMPQGVLHLS